MYCIRCTLNNGETRISQPLGDEETVSRWCLEMLRDPQVLTAVAVPAPQDPLALAA